MQKIDIIINNLKKNFKECNNINFGYKELNDELNKINYPGVLTLFGYYSRERFALINNLVLNMAKFGTNVLYITNSNSANQITKALISLESDVSLVKINNEELSEEERNKVENATNRISSTNLYIKQLFDCTSKINEDIEDSIKELKYNLSNDNQTVVVIDQCILTIDPFLIKRLSNKYNVFFLLIANARKYTNRKYSIIFSLSDVDPKIESVSDCVLCVNRPSDAYVDDNIFNIDILKHTNGVISTYEVNMSKKSLRINDVYEVDYLAYNDDLADDLPF